MSTPRPPRLARALLRIFCDAAYHEELEGDLDELFELNLANMGRRRAALRYWADVFKHFNWFFFSRRHSYGTQQNAFTMWANYFKIAFRNLIRHKRYAALNVLGLGVGMACSLLIMLYGFHELSYDNFHEKADRLFVVHTEILPGTDPIASSPNALVPHLIREFPEVESGVRIYNRGGYSPFTVQYEEQVYKEDRLFHVDSTFFNLFSFELLRGNRETCLTKPRSIVLTEEMSKKYFGEADPMGKLLRLDNRTDYQVTGVMADIPVNSHIHFDFLVSYASFTNSFFREERWDNASYTSYLLLRPNASVQSVEAKIPDMVTRSSDQEQNMTYLLNRFEDIHLRGMGASFGLEPQNEMRYLYIFGVIGLLILVVASVNYTNLATARAVHRAKEIGMRKVMGAYRKNLFSQFMGESFMVVFMAIVVALGLSMAALSSFSELADRPFGFADLLQTRLLLSLIGVGLIVGLMSGIYPALVLSGYRPLLVLKGSFKNSKSGVLIRKLLVTGQFIISMALIIGTIVIFNQITFMQEKTLGYNNKNVMILPMSPSIMQGYASFKAEMLKEPGVLDLTMVSESPTEINGGYSINIQDTDLQDPVFLAGIRADLDFVDAMQMDLVAGSFFSETDIKNVAPDLPFKDRRFAFVLNESAVKQFELSPEEVIGKRAKMNGRNGFIRGVVKDFHFASMRQKIMPMAILPDRDFNYLLLRISGQQLESTIAKVQERWRRLAPNVPFDYQFMDVEYDTLYQADQRLSKLFGVFAILAIFIACFGLFGLVAFTTAQKAREIGVRKVLGASVRHLVLLLNKTYAQLILVAFLLAGPLAYFLMSGWISEFEYRTSIGITPFFWSLAATVLVAFASVSFQSLKAATANPVNVLKEE